MRNFPLKLWPRSLQGQVLLSIALALLVAQTISAVLIWREQSQRRESQLVSSAAFRLLGPPPDSRRAEMRRARRGDDADRTPPPFRLSQSDQTPRRNGEQRLSRVEHELAEILAAQGFDATDVIVFERDPLHDPLSIEFMKRHRRELAVLSGEPMPRLVIASVQQSTGQWISTRVLSEGGDMRVLLA